MKQQFKSVKVVATMLLLLLLDTRAYSQMSKFVISLNSLTTNFNYGKANADLNPYKKNYRGLQAGFSYQAGVTPLLSIVPEIYFAMKGGTLNVNNPITHSRSTLRLNSLELPVLTRLHFGKLYLNAGPYAGYNVGGRFKVDGTGTSSGTTSKLNFGNGVDEIKRWDFGFQAGAGYNVNMKQSILTLDVRYGYGLENISQGIERYNRMLNISVQVSKSGRKNFQQKRSDTDI